MTAAEPTAVAAAPQPDRSLVLPVLHEVEDLRLHLTSAANWLFGFWPEGVPAPVWGERHADQSRGTVVLSHHAVDAAGLAAVRSAMERDNGTVVTSSTKGRASRNRPAYRFCYARRSFGRVMVEVWSNDRMWSEAFPGEALP